MVVSEEVKENVPEVKEEMSLESSEPSKWQAVKKNITSTNAGLQPRPRHGHRVVSIRGLILLERILNYSFLILY